jgi:hypothetical protein
MSAQAARPKVITQDGEPIVHFDLDAVEDEATAEPFRFTAGGKQFTCISPQDADWQTSADVETGPGLKAFVEELLGDDYNEFAKLRVTNRQLNQLIEAAQKHYGITMGESKASPRSSRNRRKR